MPDRVDLILSQWATVRPHTDYSAMALPGRLQRLSRAVTAEMTRNLAQFGLELWQFDCMATLRRATGPLTAGELAASSMISQPALTNRVDKLAAAGLLTREADPNNRRRVLIALTPRGTTLIDEVLDTHLQVCSEVASRGLTPAERETLNGLLRKALIADEDAGLA